MVDCAGNDWAARVGYSEGDIEADAGDGGDETGAAREVFAAWASLGSDVFRSHWGLHFSI